MKYSLPQPSAEAHYALFGKPGLYKPVASQLVETLCLCLHTPLWIVSDSNRSPQACKAYALPDELTTQDCGVSRRLMEVTDQFTTCVQISGQHENRCKGVLSFLPKEVTLTITTYQPVGVENSEISASWSQTRRSATELYPVTASRFQQPPEQ